MNFDSFDSLVALMKDPVGAIAWVGAGISIAAGYPSLGQLARQMADKCGRMRGDPILGGDVSDTDLLSFVLKSCANERDQLLSECFPQYPPLDHHCKLVRLPWKAIVTTNYDQLLEQACMSQFAQYSVVQHLVKIIDQNLNITAAGRLEIYKPHGCVTKFDDLILEDTTYAKYEKDHQAAFAAIESMLNGRRKVFLGCSMRDPRIIGWLRGLTPEERSGRPMSAAVITAAGWDAIPEADRILMREASIHPKFIDSHEEIPRLIADLYSACVGHARETVRKNDADIVCEALHEIFVCERGNSLPEFLEASRAIRRVHAIKRVHEDLHHVKSNIYDKLSESIAAGLTRNGHAIQSIRRLRTPLETRIDRIRAVRERYPDVVGAAWLELLEKGKDRIKEAGDYSVMTQNSPAEAKALDAQGYLNEVLSRAPGTVNHLLRQGVNNLDLGKLVNALLRIAGDVGANRASASIIGSGADALKRMEADLISLNEYHSNFQEVFDYLRSTDLRIENERPERQFRAWDVLKERMAPVYPSMEFASRRDLQRIGELIEDARSKNDTGDFLSQYSDYRVEADNEFNQVDSKLLQSCEDLASIDNKLSELIFKGHHD